MIKQHKFKQKLFSTKNGAIMSKKKELKKIPVRRLKMLKIKYHFTFRSLKKKSEIIDLLDKYCCDTGVDAYDMSYLTNLTLWELQLMAKKYPINLGGHTLKSDVVEIMHLFFSQRESFIAEIEVLAAAS